MRISLYDLRSILAGWQKGYLPPQIDRDANVTLRFLCDHFSGDGKMIPAGNFGLKAMLVGKRVRHVVAALLEAGHQVASLDLFRPERPLKAVNWVVGSALDEALLASATSDCETVISVRRAACRRPRTPIWRQRSYPTSEWS